MLNILLVRKSLSLSLSQLDFEFKCPSSYDCLGACKCLDIFILICLCKMVDLLETPILILSWSAHSRKWFSEKIIQLILRQKTSHTKNIGSHFVLNEVEIKSNEFHSRMKDGICMEMSGLHVVTIDGRRWSVDAKFLEKR